MSSRVSHRRDVFSISIQIFTNLKGRLSFFIHHFRKTYVFFTHLGREMNETEEITMLRFTERLSASDPNPLVYTPEHPYSLNSLRKLC